MLTLSAQASQRALRQGGLKITVSCARGPCAVSAQGVVTVPSNRRGASSRRFNTRSAKRTLRGNERATLTLRFSPLLRAQISRALSSVRTRKRIRAAITATAVAAAGNRQTKRVTVRIRR